jgi:hypothetical protein
MPSQVYTTAGTVTWTAPTGVTSVTAQCWGGGGGGAEASTGSSGSGGGGGGGEFAQDTVAVTPTSGYSVVVGAAGTGGSGQEGSGTGANGGNGGNSAFTGNAGAVVRAHGGSGGHLNPAGGGSGPGGAGGTGSANTIAFPGGAGGTGNGAGYGAGGGSSAGGSSAGSAGGGSTGAASVTVVQSAQGINAAGTTITIALPSPTTAGNCLAAVIQSYSYSYSGANPSVQAITIGGLTDNWSQLAGYGSAGSWTIASVWADPNCTGGQTSVKITCGGGGGPQTVAASVFEVSGLVTTGVLDKTTGMPNVNAATSWTSGTTAATSQAVEIAFGGVSGVTNFVTGPAAPWVNLATLAAQSSGDDHVNLAGYQILSSTGGQAYAGTFGSAGGYTSEIATLKGTAGTGGGGGAAVALGGPGGAGGAGAGSAPASGPGGGGGGSGAAASDGGAGWAGQVILTWTAPIPSPPPVASPSLTIPGPVASVLAAALAANAANPYNSLGQGQRRRATVATTTAYPALPSLMTDVVFMPEFAVLDANVTVTGPILAESGVDVNTAGQGLSVAEGTNCKQGTAILSAGTAVVQNTSVTSSSRIFLTSQSDGGTPGFLRVSTRTAGVSFTITSSSGSDTSTVAYELIEPG